MWFTIWPKYIVVCGTYMTRKERHMTHSALPSKIIVRMLATAVITVSLNSDRQKSWWVNPPFTATRIFTELENLEMCCWLNAFVKYQRQPKGGVRVISSTIHLLENSYVHCRQVIHRLYYCTINIIIGIWQKCVTGVYYARYDNVAGMIISCPHQQHRPLQLISFEAMAL
jgi:hypothetical protein